MNTKGKVMYQCEMRNVPMRNAQCTNVLMHKCINVKCVLTVCLGSDHLFEFNKRC